MKLRVLATLLVLTALLPAISCRKEKTAASSPEAGTPAGTDTRVSESPEPAGGPPAVGNRMPSYEATGLDGSPFRLSERNGKVVLLNVWATWCGPCRYEIPELQALHEKFGAKGLEVVGVSIDDPGAQNDVRAFVTSYKVGYPVVLDPGGRIAELFETTVIPTSVLIDRKGTIVWMHRGVVTQSNRALQDALQKAL